MRSPPPRPGAGVAQVTHGQPAPKPRPDKAARQRDQRRVARDRQTLQDLRRRADQLDVLPTREEEGAYRP
jgi:hypothetical protein